MVKYLPPGLAFKHFTHSSHPNSVHILLTDQPNETFLNKNCVLVKQILNGNIITEQQF